METVVTQEALKLPKPKRDYSKLKEQQLAVSNSEEFKTRGGQIRDDNPIGYTQRGYEQLAKIKMPMILDQLTGEDGKPRHAWTIEEVLSAMQPSILSLASKYARRKAGFQMDEAESLGREAVLVALWKDLGLAWFAGYSYEKIEAAIKRGSKISDTIRTSESNQEFRIHIGSMDESYGEGDATRASTIDEATPLILRERCGDHYRITPQKRYEIIKDALPFLNLSPEKLAEAEKFNKAESVAFSQQNLTSTGYLQLLKEFRTKLTKVIGREAAKLIVDKFLPEGARKYGTWVTKGSVGAVFSPSCHRGRLPDHTICGRCGGTGRKTVFEEKTIKTPDELAGDRMKIEEFRRLFQLITAELEPKQKLALMLREGLDEDGHRREVSEVADIMREMERKEEIAKAKQDIAQLEAKLLIEQDEKQKAILTTKIKQLKFFAANHRGCGSKNRVAQILAKAYYHIQEVQGKSKIITEAIDRILDEG